MSIDLTAVSFMDSSGLGCLLMAREAAIRTLGSVVVTACSDHARRVIEISGTWPVLTGFYADSEPRWRLARHVTSGFAAMGFHLRTALPIRAGDRGSAGRSLRL